MSDCIGVVVMVMNAGATFSKHVEKDHLHV